MGKISLYQKTPHICQYTTMNFIKKINHTYSITNHQSSYSVSSSFNSATAFILQPCRSQKSISISLSSFNLLHTPVYQTLFQVFGLLQPISSHYTTYTDIKTSKHSRTHSKQILMNTMLFGQSCQLTWIIVRYFTHY